MKIDTIEDILADMEDFKIFLEEDHPLVFKELKNDIDYVIRGVKSLQYKIQTLEFTEVK